jgi:hypothetical protein
MASVDRVRCNDLPRIQPVFWLPAESLDKIFLFSEVGTAAMRIQEVISFSKF